MPWHRRQPVYGSDPEGAMPEYNGSPRQVDDLALYLQRRRLVQIDRRARIARRRAAVLVARRTATSAVDLPAR